MIFSNAKKKSFLILNFCKIKLIKTLFCCCLVGLICGVLVVCLNFNGVDSQCKLIVKIFLNNRFTQPFVMTCFCSFMSCFIALLLVFILGFIPISQVIFFIIPIFYGLGFGTTISFLIALKGIESLFVILLEFVPYMLTFMLVLILSCKESIKFANKTFKKLFLRANELIYKKEFVSYLIKFLMLLCFQLIFAILDGFCNFIFFKT